MDIVTTDIWPQISKAAKDSGISYVAVAYLGKGAFDQLPLPSGSTLVVDASEPSVMSGATNPFEIIRYLEAGVNVFNRSRLHAKVYVFSNQVWIGSANASGRSRTQLQECMVVSREKMHLRDATRFVKSLALDRIERGYADHLTTIYTPPKHLDQSENSLWIQELSDYEYTEQEQQVHEANEERLSGKLSSEEYSVDSIKFDLRDAFASKSIAGDILIQIYEGFAYAPVRVLGKAASYADNSLLVFFEESNNDRTIPLPVFVNKLEALGIKYKARRYPRPQDVNSILKVWGT